MDESSLNLEEDLQEIKNNKNFSNNDNDGPNDIFPKENSFENSYNQKGYTGLDSQNDLNKAVIMQNTMEKFTTMKKESNNQILLSEINEDHEHHHNENSPGLAQAQIKEEGLCGWCGNNEKGSCCLI